MGSLEFSKKLLNDAKVAVSPGVGFGEYGDDHVRFSLIENETRTRQALRGIREMFKKDGLASVSAGSEPGARAAAVHWQLRPQIPSYPEHPRSLRREDGVVIEATLLSVSWCSGV